MDERRTDEQTTTSRLRGDADGEPAVINRRTSTAAAASHLSALRLDERQQGSGETDVPVSDVSDLAHLVPERTTDAGSPTSSTPASSSSTNDALRQSASSSTASADPTDNSNRGNTSSHTVRGTEAVERDRGGARGRGEEDAAGGAPRLVAVGERTGDPSSQCTAEEDTERRQEQVASVALGLADVFGASLLRLQAAVTSAQRSQQSLDEAMARLATGKEGGEF